MKTGLIYKITNNISKHMYIGKTTRTIEYRWKQHIRDARNPNKDTVLGRAITKYGKDAFTIEVIVSNVPVLFLNSFERYWINYYNTFNGIGYNCTAGGDGTYKVTPWNKGKTGVFSQETIEKMRNAKLGKTPTNLTQLRELAKTRKGNLHPNAKLANIYLYATNELIAERVNISEWCKENNQNQGNLAMTARDLRKQSNGYYAVYLPKEAFL